MHTYASKYTFPNKSDPTTLNLTLPPSLSLFHAIMAIRYTNSP